MTNSPQILAEQLRCPEGEDGILLRHSMNMCNLSLILNGISKLNLYDDDHMLELGYGNGGLLGYILSLAKNLQYTGLEISPTMHEQAITLNQPYVSAGLAQYQLYDGIALPFREPVFDKVLSVNTIYFWEQPVALLRSICQVLKMEGLFCITFCEQSFMRKLPFSKYEFQLYNTQAVKQLTYGLPLQLIDEDHQKDKAISKTGALVDREFTSLVWRKLS